MQAAEELLIEGFYVDGEMRYLNDMLVEVVSGTDGDKRDFIRL